MKTTSKPDHSYNLFLYKNLILTLILLSLNLTNTYSQPYTFTKLENQELQLISSGIDTQGWIKINDTVEILSNTLIDDYHNDFGLGLNDSLGLYKNIVDSPFIHNTYYQLYKGIKVEGAQLSVHSIDSLVYLIHGKIIDSLELDINPNLSGQNAIDSALNYVAATLYAWEEDSTEAYPSATLLLAHLPNTPFHRDNYILCFKILVNAEEPLSSQYVYINAKTGEFSFSVTTEALCNGENGTGQTTFYGTQDLSIRHRWFQNDYVLEDCEKGFHTKYFEGGGGGWASGNNVTDDDGNYHGSLGDHNVRGVTAHWTAGVTHNIFKNVFNHIGMGSINHPAPLRIYVSHISEETFGPRYVGLFSTKRIYIGLSDFQNLLDVMAHEWTHGFTEASSNLQFHGESGFLNESFSDIFAKIVEWREANEWSLNGFFHPANHEVDFSWQLGKQGGVVERSLEDPESENQPSQYQGDFWCTSGCGWHGNGGVQNHWFYLLSEGSANNPMLTGIGIQNASKIVYRNVTRYIQEYSNYHDARLGSIQATQDLFGRCSEEDYQNQLAWQEVALGTAVWCANITGPNKICLGDPNTIHSEDEAGIYRVETVDGAQITWLINSTWTYQITGIHGQVLTVTDWGNSGLQPCVYIGAQITFNGTSITRYFKVCFVDCKDPIDPLININSTIDIAGESRKNQYEIYPNPMNNELFIKSKFKQEAKLYIYNILNQVVYSNVVSIGLNSYKIDNDLQPGIYILKIVSDGKQADYSGIHIIME